jgi:hypothetical protein
VLPIIDAEITTKATKKELPLSGNPFIKKIHTIVNLESVHVPSSRTVTFFITTSTSGTDGSLKY